MNAIHSFAEIDNLRGQFEAAQGRIAKLEAQLLAASELLEPTIGRGVGIMGVAEAVKEVLNDKIEHSRYWYACRFERLNQFAREELPEELKMRYFSIVANGTAEPGEPPTYAQQYNMLKHRAEQAEARADAAEKQIERLGEIVTECDGIECNKHDVLVRGAVTDRLAAEAASARLKEVLAKVEAWMSGEDGPLFSLWENADIGQYEHEDGGEQDWPTTLSLVLDLKVPADRLGCDHMHPEVTLYREIRAALGDGKEDGGEWQFCALDPECWRRAGHGGECKDELSD